jgi:hypothetical protein
MSRTAGARGVGLDEGMALRVRSTLGWLFRDRRTGRVVIAQIPNIPLVVWITAASLRWLVDGDTGTALGVIAMLALVVWAADEIIRGVNPWRRFVGAVVLGGLIVRVSM